MYNTPELAEIGMIGEVVLGSQDNGNDSATDQRLPFEGLIVGLDE